MTVLTEGPRTAGYLISEAADMYRSRDVGVLAAGVVGTLVAGTVLGKVPATGHFNIYNPAANDGTQNVAGILFEDGVAGDERTITARDSAVKASQLSWFAGATNNQIATAVAAFKAFGVVVRN